MRGGRRRAGQPRPRRRRRFVRQPGRGARPFRRKPTGPYWRDVLTTTLEFRLATRVRLVGDPVIAGALEVASSGRDLYAAELRPAAPPLAR